MKVIDFACRFLARLQQGELTLPAHQVLLAIAAGLETSPDISRLTGVSQSATTHTIKNLEKSRLITCISRSGGAFCLSSAGKDYVCRLFAFAKPNPYAQKTTPDH